jgi:acyl-CoA synthetase (AMP-forming)/AMP-acid ligase II
MQSGYDIPIPEQILRLGATCPHSIASSLGGQLLSYAELNRHADQFAAYLARRSVVPGGTVAVSPRISFW